MGGGGGQNCCHIVLGVRLPGPLLARNCKIWGAHWKGERRTPQQIKGKSQKIGCYRSSPWVKPGRFGSFFVLCFLALGRHCLQMLCLPGFGTHANTQNLPHFFVLSLLVFGSTLSRNAYFSRQTQNCQIVPVLPSYMLPFESKLLPLDRKLLHYITLFSRINYVWWNVIVYIDNEWFVN